MQAPHSALLDPARAQRGQADAVDGSSRAHAAHKGWSPLAVRHNRQSWARSVRAVLRPKPNNLRNECDKRVIHEHAYASVMTNRVEVNYCEPINEHLSQMPTRLRMRDATTEEAPTYPGGLPNADREQ